MTRSIVMLLKVTLATYTPLSGMSLLKYYTYFILLITIAVCSILHWGTRLLLRTIAMVYRLLVKVHRAVECCGTRTLEAAEDLLNDK